MRTPTTCAVVVQDDLLDDAADAVEVAVEGVQPAGLEVVAVVVRDHLHAGPQAIAHRDVLEFEDVVSDVQPGAHDRHGAARGVRPRSPDR